MDWRCVWNKLLNWIESRVTTNSNEYSNMHEKSTSHEYFLEKMYSWVPTIASNDYFMKKHTQVPASTVNH